MSGSDLPSAPARRTSVAEQQALLRRVAVLVAGGADAADVFAAIAREVAQLLRPRLVQIYRWERDGTATVVGTWGDGPNPFAAGSNWRWNDPTLVAMTEHMRTGRPIRIEDVAESIAGEPVEAGMSVGVGSAAGAPVVVDGEAWGQDGWLRLEVRDDGVGGADPEGHGLLGLGDRVAARGGRIRIASPRGGGTVVAAELPLPD